jgi:integration host factor subunit alpha
MKKILLISIAFLFYFVPSISHAVSITYMLSADDYAFLSIDGNVVAGRDHTGVPFKQAYELVETTLEIIKTTLAGGDDILISGFGKFQVKAKNVRKGRNPQTGESMILRPRKVVTFRCSGQLKNKLSQSVKE